MQGSLESFRHATKLVTALASSQWTSLQRIMALQSFNVLVFSQRKESLCACEWQHLSYQTMRNGEKMPRSTMSNVEVRAFLSLSLSPFPSLEV